MSIQTSRYPQTAAEAGAFAEYLVQVGDRRHFISSTLGPDFIKVPEDMLLDVSSLPQSNIENKLGIDYLTYGNHPEDYFADRIILTPKNTDVLAINNLILETIPEVMHEFTSVDSVDGDDELQRQEHGDLYPPKFLNIISLSGIPPHKFNLKVSATELDLELLSYDQIPWSLRSALMSDVFKGIKNSAFPFELRRKYFQYRVPFAMTINN
ncbi:Helitron helicase [Phytophthora megakarya]|uniref:Helitron helicase n=1 Tax=Phytophthora megakarya TaxID=4795 RepID=A0A225V9L2_9STRA|nr:Helitron helicase [Phytophthora megakarya]